MNKNFLPSLSTLIKLLNANASFYRHAQLQVTDNRLANKFDSLQKLHEYFSNQLQPYIVSVWRDQEGGIDLPPEWRQLYSSFLTTLRQNSNGTYKDQFEAIEQETIGVIDQAIKQSPHKVITDQLYSMREDILSHYNAILTVQRRIVA